MELTPKVLRQEACVFGLPVIFARRRWLIWGVRLCVTTGIIAWLLRQLNLQELQRVVVPPAVTPLLGMIGTAWLFVLLGGIKFWVLHQGLTPVPFSSFITHFVVATSFGAFTPASLGDFSLAAFLRREQIPVHESMSVIVVDRAVTLSMYVAIFLPLTFGLFMHTGHLWWIPGSVMVSGTSLLALNRVVAVRRAVRRVLRSFPVPFLSDFLATTSTLLLQHPWHLLSNVGLTFLRCLVSGLVVQCVLWAVGERLPFLPVLYTTNTIAILNLLPISLAGLGVYESGGVTILGQLGFDQERIFVAFIYLRAYVLLSSLLILAFTYLRADKRGRLIGRSGKQNNDSACAS